jgi:HAD superfamily hydrolase (TIGR01509 family)
MTDCLFDLKTDYQRHVDGKMRLSGIESFLHSRALILPLGQDEDQTLDTVTGIGNIKNSLFRSLLEKEGVTIFDDSVRLMGRLQKGNHLIGLASSSKNARPVLEKAGLLDLFVSIMDGMVAHHYGIASKPSPDFYRHAAQLINTLPDHCVVIEDAISGVASAKNAGIRCVIGIDRHDNADALLSNGADIVVKSLDDIDMSAFIIE